MFNRIWSYLLYFRGKNIPIAEYWLAPVMKYDPLFLWGTEITQVVHQLPTGLHIQKKSQLTTKHSNSRGKGWSEIRLQHFQLPMRGLISMNAKIIKCSVWITPKFWRVYNIFLQRLSSPRPGSPRMARANTSSSLSPSLLVSPTLVTSSCLLPLILSTLVTSAQQSEAIQRKVCWSSCGQENAIQVAILNCFFGQRKVVLFNILVHLYNHRVKNARLWPQKLFDIPFFEKYVCFACIYALGSWGSIKQTLEMLRASISGWSF